MKSKIRHLRIVLPLLLAGIFLFSFTLEAPETAKSFPYKKAGLTKRQAAAHLLDRFTFGPRAGQVDEVVESGIENWFAQQLRAGVPDATLNEMLTEYSALAMSNAEIIRSFPKGAQVRRMAIRDGAIRIEDVSKDEKGESRRALADYMRANGYKSQRELYVQLAGQKILRAAYSQNQLQEVLTGFWFNHFNVSLTDNDCARFIIAYERDVIRPNALGKFEALLLATAKSPAMLTYLDNFRSGVAPVPVRKSKATPQNARPSRADSVMQQLPAKERAKNNQGGLNENYAREIMELHTLGVDGGYTQDDVTDAARIFTGWTIDPSLNDYPKGKAANNSNARNFSANGFVREGDFLFAANRHDKGEKVVLGTRFPADGGYEEGVKLIRMLSQHPATARFIAYKLAVRFVNDTPPQALVDKMANTFIKTEGDIREVLTTLVSAPEFWSKETIGEKIKSPFEVAISAVRSVDAEITNPSPLYGWIAKMGEKLYAYQAPTGFPDKGQYWINTGSLLSRMNFGLAIASNRIPGVKVDLPRLHQRREPESAQEALAIYSRYMMPERNLDETIRRLTPVLNDPAFSDKVDRAANKEAPAKEDMVVAHGSVKRDVLGQVVGIVIGSPEFQRR
jgi:uncharacterized protein (DUF1800 family)